jgi:TfoX/Sxy family transcriptional regulator of competence genes
VIAFAMEPHVMPPDGSRGFGSHALRVGGKIFAMVARGHLVVKLPKARVDALVDSGDGIRFDANKGKPMKEWLSLDAGSTMDWELLAREALAFVASA